MADAVAAGAELAWPGCRVSFAASGHEALNHFEQARPHFVMLDLAVSRPDGLEVLRRIRRASQVPVVVLTERGDRRDEIQALDLGADDYLTNPVDSIDVLARLRALARRTRLPQRPAGQPPQDWLQAISPWTRHWAR